MKNIWSCRLHSAFVFCVCAFVFMRVCLGYVRKIATTNKKHTHTHTLKKSTDRVMSTLSSSFTNFISSGFFFARFR